MVTALLNKLVTRDILDETIFHRKSSTGRKAADIDVINVEYVWQQSTM